MKPENVRLVTVADLQIEPRSPRTVCVYSRTEGRGLEISLAALPIILAFSSTSTVESAFATCQADGDLPADLFEAVVERCIERGILVYADNRSVAPARMRAYRALTAGPLSAQDGRNELALRSPIHSQQPPDYYPGLAAKEIHDPSRFEWVNGLESEWTTIDRELGGLISEEPNLFRSVHRDFTEQGGWAAAYLWSHGEMDGAVCDRCPETAKMIQNIPGTTEIGTVMFSVLGPKTRVAPHCGTTNTRLRCQLPLRVPGDCVLRVGDYVLELKEGRCLIFDDSFIHSAWNESDLPRFVLLLDLLHPDLDAGEVDFLIGKVRQARPGVQYLSAPQDGPSWLRDRGAENGDREHAT